MDERRIGPLQRVPESYSNLWEQFRTEHPDLFGLLSRMKVSFVIRRHKRDTILDERATLSLSDLLRRRFGFGIERISVPQLARELGMTTGAISNLTQGILGYVSSETGLPFHSPLGINARLHVDQIRDLVQQQHILERRMEQGVPLVEQAAIRLYLLGYRFDNLAARLTTDLDLTPPVGETLVTTIINQALRRVDYRGTYFFTARAFKARTLLKEAQEGTYRNQKAKATVNVLELMEEGYTRGEIIEETDIRNPDYCALVNEAFIDLQEDETGRKDLAEVYRMISKEPFVPLINKAKNRAARLLYEPYKAFRIRLGEQVADSGELTHSRLSARERAILEAISTGLTGVEIAIRFSLGDTYCTAVSRWLLGETDFVSHKDRLEERRKMFINLQDDIRQGNPVPDRLLSFASLPSTVVLRFLADGLLIAQTAEAISRQTGLVISRHAIMNFCARVRAHYRQVQ